MDRTYLFDWGDTLMVDFPGSRGKMYQWETVKCVEGAKATLCFLARAHKIYIATSAVDSCEADIAKAFKRVGLSEYISGYFCYGNIGIYKGSVNFYWAIQQRLKIPLNKIVMVGDNFEKDIRPALASGMNAIWYNPDNAPQTAIIPTLIEGQSSSEIHTLQALQV
ncbi:HAD family hydrolase [Paraglaciecola sp. 20A4]|uniref:HAD family hydrolase n=1 Tax=Paraglaciecola sp. 20A4 TaxID=2687288 RepID=UPI00197F131B|nr:HAD family hydrolase [Paraglaciecola sp. 20A4]